MFIVIRKLIKYNSILMSIKCIFNISAPRSGAGQLVMKYINLNALPLMVFERND
jgi:hypothetical protein